MMIWRRLFENGHFSALIALFVTRNRPAEPAGEPGSFAERSRPTVRT